MSGVILFDETIRQNASDGRPLAEDPRGAGRHPRHQGRQGHGASSRSRPTSSSPTGSTGCARGWSSTASLGARFAKWRAVITIGAHIPSQLCLDVNAHALARYAALCQDEGIVPIVEPEVLMDGDHSLERCYQVTTRHAAHASSTRCTTSASSSTGMLLKPNMVIPGKGHASYPVSPETVADATISCFRMTVPAAVPGIVFLSGGQGDEEATANLERDQRQGSAPVAALVLVRARAAGRRAARRGRVTTRTCSAGQAAYLHRAHMNGLARSGCVLGRRGEGGVVARPGGRAPLVQRVTEARVRVDGDVVGEIGAGLCVLVGVTHDDDAARAAKLAAKVANLRVFDDDAGAMNRSLLDTRRRRAGREPVHALRRHRPRAAAELGRRRPARARRAARSTRSSRELAALGVPVATGRFRADMQVALVNDGPVTLLLEVCSVTSALTHV